MPVSTNASGPKDETRNGGWLIYLIAFFLVLVGVLVIAAAKGVFHRGPSGPTSPTVSAIPAQYSSDRVMGYLQAICNIGT